MYPIGEFSLITRLSVKALRYYHEEGILVPDHVDEDSGYRYYRKSSIDRATAIVKLRAMEFSVSEIREILLHHSDDSEIVSFFERQMSVLDEKAKEYWRMRDSISNTIDTIRRSEKMINGVDDEVLVKYIDDMIFAGYRFTGAYDEVGKAFAKVGRAAGRKIAGPAMTLYYDGEFREKDADMEGGFPLSQKIDIPGIDCRVLRGGKAVTVIHRGSYESIGKSYERLFARIESDRMNPVYPSREIYLKGPGLIFKGNPRNYVTELQVIVRED